MLDYRSFLPLKLLAEVPDKFSRGKSGIISSCTYIFRINYRSVLLLWLSKKLVKPYHNVYFRLLFIIKHYFMYIQIISENYVNL